MPLECIKKILKFCLFSDIMRKNFRAKRNGQVMRKGYLMDMRIILSPTGAMLLGRPFDVDKSNIIEVHDDRRAGWLECMLLHRLLYGLL